MSLAEQFVKERFIDSSRIIVSGNKYWFEDNPTINWIVSPNLSKSKRNTRSTPYCTICRKFLSYRKAFGDFTFPEHPCK